MFTKQLQKRNANLIQFILKQHSEGLLEPDTYVLDLDMIKINARKLFNKAKDNNMEIFQMTKQFGRNPIVAKAIANEGINEVVAVDWKEAKVLFKNGLKIGNIGHVVQVPKSEIDNVINMSPKYWTIYSFDNLKNINELAQKRNYFQDVIVRVYKNESDLYPSQKGGIHINELEKLIVKANKLKNVRIVGVTSFPCVLLNQEKNKFTRTNNFQVILDAASLLEKHNIKVKHINAPSANCLMTIDMIKKFGANGIEPGHAFTGTNPLIEGINHHEIPAMAYYSQVSHIFKDKIIVFAGGHYRRSKMKGALIGKDLNFMDNILLDREAIDYYFEFKNNINANINVGDSVISLFRSQIFVTRSKVKVVKGVHSGNPVVLGTFDSKGSKIDE